MLALSPPLFLTSYGWPLEDLITQNPDQDCNVSKEVEANSYHSLLDDFCTYDQIQHDFAPENSFSSEGAVNGNKIGDPRNVARKLNHNASERDRRKRVNNLYTFLRSLLPMSCDQKKKVSIPGTVSCALKYIPELQKEVEKLKSKREKLLACHSYTTIFEGEHLEIRNGSPKGATIQTIPSVLSSVCVLDDKELVIQLISSNDYMNTSKEIGCLSMVLEYLEEEEDGLVLLNATTFKCLGEERFLNTLHLQVQSNHIIEVEKLKEKICSLYQQSRELLL